MRRLLCAGVLLSICCVAPAFGQNERPHPLFDPQFSKLRAIKVLSNHDRSFGDSNDFYVLSKEFLESHTVKEFKRMSSDRSPIIRAMGLLGLAQTDADEHYLTLLLHSNDEATVYLHEGCVISTITVGEFARRLLSNPYFLDPEGKLPAM